MGIEPTPSAWKAEVLPLNYTRLFLPLIRYSHPMKNPPELQTGGSNQMTPLVEGEGFEPSKA